MKEDNINCDEAEIVGEAIQTKLNGAEILTTIQHKDHIRTGIISSRQPFVLFFMEIVILILPKEKNITEEVKDQALHQSISEMSSENLHSGKYFY